MPADTGWQPTPPASSQVQCPRVLRPAARAEAGRGSDQGWLLLPEGARLLQGHRRHAAVPRQVGPPPLVLTFLPTEGQTAGSPWGAENGIAYTPSPLPTVAMGRASGPHLEKFPTPGPHLVCCERPGGGNCQLHRPAQAPAPAGHLDVTDSEGRGCVGGTPLRCLGLRLQHGPTVTQKNSSVINL